MVLYDKTFSNYNVLRGLKVSEKIGREIKVSNNGWDYGKREIYRNKEISIG